MMTYCIVRHEEDALHSTDHWPLAADVHRQTSGHPRHRSAAHSPHEERQTWSAGRRPFQPPPPPPPLLFLPWSRRATFSLRPPSIPSLQIFHGHRWRSAWTRESWRRLSAETRWSFCPRGSPPPSCLLSVPPAPAVGSHHSHSPPRRGTMHICKQNNTDMV